MKFGDLLCLKTTGELVFVLEVFPGTDDTAPQVEVRRPTMTREGITHAEDMFYQDELETPEQHLRYEAKEMVLKANIQEEILNAREAERVEKKTDVTVN
jgi:hypothetical protein